MASIAAALTGSATSKSGRPIERLIGSFIDFDMSNALRIPEASIWLIRSAIQASFTARAPGSSHRSKGPVNGSGRTIVTRRGAVRGGRAALPRVGGFAYLGKLDRSGTGPSKPRA